MVSWQVRRVAETGSTNADVVTLATAGAAEGTVLVADYQSAGRGRLGRSWQAPPGTGLAVSLLLRPTKVPAHRWTWLPLLTGVVVVEALRSHPGAEATLKWPNDVQMGSAKLAGILVERVDGPAGAAAVVGVGLNISAAPSGATSLLAAGFPGTSRDEVLAAFLDRFARRYGQWRIGVGDPQPWLVQAYSDGCDTLGREVEAHVPGQPTIFGRAVAVDGDGRLVVRTSSGDVAVGAGDVTHLRTV